MAWRILRRQGVIPLLLILAAVAYWRLHPRPPKFISVGYVADRSVTLWNTLAQVKQPVAELHYGDRVEVMREDGTAAQVQTAAGVVGWLVDSRQIMDSQLWGQSADLLAHAKTLPIQARGETKTVSNVRIEPGRNANRVFQLMRGTPVVVLERTVADASQSAEENSQEEKNAPPGQQKPKLEDWLLIMRTGNNGQTPATVDTAPVQDQTSTPNVPPASGDPVSGGPARAETASSTDDTSAHVPATPIAGWVLARFIELSLPDPVKDYASSADLRVVAWFELNRVADGSGGEAPQYLVAGTRGPEGLPCDFTMLRVYTWGAARKRYETAYVESDLCGRLPIRTSQSEKGPEFQFAEAGSTTAPRTYVMQQTAVRRVLDESDRKPRSRRSNP